MTTLFGWGPMFGCPGPSPYVLKSDMQLQMLGVEFDRKIADLEAVSKHKAPYVEDEGQIIQDSSFIRAHFESKLDKILDDYETNEERGVAWALERMAEGHLLTTMAMERWLVEENFNKGPRLFFMDVPAEMREQVCKDVVAEIAATQQGTGMARHSREERLRLAKWDIMAIAATLGAKPFLMGDKASAPDASVSAALISCATDYFDTPLVDMVREYPNLVEYMQRVEETYFAENKWPQMAIA